MPVQTSYPGVYVQEVSSGVHTIAGVSTSIAMFIGMTKSGPMNQPVRLNTYTDFVRTFSDDTSAAQLPNYVKLFFLNGGTDCYVMRIADGATAATVVLKNENAAGAVEVLKLTAKNAGTQGESLRAIVSYGGAQPEATFNIDLFQWQIDNRGNRVRSNAESWRNLSMDPASPLYAPVYITQNSTLANADPVANLPPKPTAYSVSGRAVPDKPNFKAAWTALLGADPSAAGNRFQISVNGSAYVEVDLKGITVSTPAQLPTDITNAVNQAMAAQFVLNADVTVTLIAGGAPNTRRLYFEPKASTGDIFIRPGSTSDLAGPLMLGTAQGGLEVSSFAVHRPAPNGVTFQPSQQALFDWAALKQNALTGITLDMLNTDDGTFAATAVPMTGGTLPSIVTTAAADSMAIDGNANSSNGNGDGIREKLGIIAQRIAQFAPAAVNLKNKWQASVAGYRLTLLPNDDLDDNFLTTSFKTAVPSLDGNFNEPPKANVRTYSFGVSGKNLGNQTSAAAPAGDGITPTAPSYAAAYDVIDREVDLFNLMILPPDLPGKDTSAFYGDASVFCQQRSAVLLMDPPVDWQDANTASTKVQTLRIGLVKDFAAVFFPRITVINNQGASVKIGPAGAIAGLCARIDGTRGVWKAPAGIEADIRGITGVDYKMSDRDHGVINPRGVNAVRVFPSGIVNFGARTMSGDDDDSSEYKYIPIRRLALFMEVSLYRGLKWVVFEPNDEPLWAQIRLNVGAFMHDLFRKGAFQGPTSQSAYFVKCDAETTTQTDRDLGIVNIWVGFAPLKPAEFVVLYLQQMAGQIQV